MAWKYPSCQHSGVGCKIVNWQPGDTLTPTSAAGVGTKIMPEPAPLPLPVPVPVPESWPCGAAEGQVRDRRQGNNSLVSTFCRRRCRKSFCGLCYTIRTETEPNTPILAWARARPDPDAGPDRRALGGGRVRWDGRHMLRVSGAAAAAGLHFSV